MKNYLICKNCERIAIKKQLCLVCLKVKKEVLHYSSNDAIEEIINDLQYRINSNGVIEKNSQQTRSNKISWMIVNTYKTFQGYHRITYKRRTIQVHRIIYATFNGELKAGKVINHIDGNPSNNSASNLEQISQKDNIIRSKNRKTPRRTYTEEFKNLVREDHKNGLSYRELTLKYFISKGTVYSFLFSNSKKLVA